MEGERVCTEMGMADKGGGRGGGGRGRGCGLQWGRGEKFSWSNFSLNRYTQVHPVIAYFQPPHGKLL